MERDPKLKPRKWIDDGLAPVFGPEKEKWRERAGYFSHEEGLALVEDASKGLTLVENE